MAEETRLREYLEKATTELKRSRRQLREAERRAREPIAIVGIGCRYPGGVATPQQFWELVAAGADGIGPFPADRGWDLQSLYNPDPDHPGTTYVREAGFVDDLADFDAGFFGIGPREATSLDPQQRLLLETSWEAIEDAGIDPRALHGSPTGVFMGGGLSDYAVAVGTGDSSGTLAGNFGSVLSGRISYSLGFRGGAVSIDTACSSSLVAIHLAAQALRGGECSLALAGGAAIMGTPLLLIDVNRQRALAFDGRCKAFAEEADGTSFGEGAGVVLLERLSDAERNGHPVLAVVRGSAVNQDGASNGLAAPNGPAQEEAIRQALAAAGLAASEVDAVEAHGTGTPLGDPIEAGALLATYGQGRAEPLRVGSVKSNIGHAAAAAGVAGVIKMTLALREGLLPQTLHAETPSSKIDWSAGAVELLTEPLPWEPGDRPRRAGVSSFGMSGTNAHLILEEAPPLSSPAGDGDAAGEGGAEPALPGFAPVVLSAKSDAALREAAGRLASRLRDEPGLEVADVAYSSVTTRPSFAHRAVVSAADREALLSALVALAGGIDGAEVCRGIVRGDRRPAFVFPGHGSGWPGMGVELLEASPTYARAIRECDEAFEPYLGWSIEGSLRGVEGAPTPETPGVWPPTLFSTSVALAKLWRACGVEPSAVVGHSQGELVAAHIAGGLSLEDAARASALRTYALRHIMGKGAMASVSLPAAALEAHLEPYGERVGIAAINGPSGAVVSGDPEPLDELLTALVAEGVRAKKIEAAIVASHSVQIEELRDELMEAFAPLQPRSGEVPFHSTVTGEQMDTAQLDAEYWFQNFRRTVRLEPVVRRLLGEGCRTLLEVSPHPVLGVALRETAESELADPDSVAVLGTLRRGEGGVERFGRSLAEAHAAGVEVDWERLYAGSGARRTKLPTYPFQRKRHWQEPSAAAGNVGAAGLADPEHALLGAIVDAPGGDAFQLSGRLSVTGRGWVADHRVLDAASIPASAFLELALHAAEEANATIAELGLDEAPAMPESGALQLRVSVGPSDERGQREIAVHSRPEGEAAGEGWTRNAAGSLAAETGGSDTRPDRLGRAPWPPPEAEALDPEAIYDRLAAAGLEVGPALRGIGAAWRGEGEILAEVRLSEAQASEAEGFALHPALLESLAHLAFVGEGEGGGGDAVALPASWRGVRTHASGVQKLRVRIDTSGAEPSLVAVDEDGAPVLSIEAMIPRPVDPEQLRAAARRRSLYRLAWPELGARGADPDGLRIATLGDVDALELEAERFDDLAQLAAAVEAGAPAPDVVLVAAPGSPVGDEPPPAAARGAARWGLELAQAWAGAVPLAGSRLAFLTERAVAAVAGETPALALAPLWGLVHSAHSEHLGRFAIVDVDGEGASRQALPAALASGAAEPQLAIREGRLLVPRLAAAQPAAGDGARRFDPERTVLITGGVSGIGAQVARHLVLEHGVRHLLLASRSGRQAAGAEELEAELCELGAAVEVAACDVADRERLATLLASIPAERPLGAVVHSAAVLDNVLLASLDAERLERVMRPKVDAAAHLDQLTRDADLSHFVLFSSVGGLLGNATQANYAAANAFLDALAADRRARGLVATSVAWGGWMQESSLVESLDDVTRARLERFGVGAMLPEQGLDHFDAACATEEPLIAPVLLDRAALRERAVAGTLPAVLAGLIRVKDTREESLRSRLAKASTGEEEEAIALGLVRSHVATVLGHSSGEEVDPHLTFQEMGIDSLGTVELCNGLVAAAGVPVPILALVNNPTPTALCRYLLAQVKESGDGGAGEGGGAISESAFVSLLGQARRQDTIDEFVAMLTAAAGFRPSFADPAAAGERPAAVRLAQGSEAPSVVLIPSAGAMSGTHEYVRLARELDGRRTVLSLPLLGFVEGEPVPASVEAVAEVHAEALAQSEVGTDVVLAGHSSGGWLAHALAERLEREGAGPAAVLLLDTYLPRAEMLKRILPRVVAGLHEAAEANAGIDDARLTAMGAYSRIFSTWEPAELRAPTILIRASSPIEGAMTADEPWQAAWELPHTVVEVAGDHMTMMTDHAASTAEAIWAALADGDREYAIDGAGNRVEGV